MCSVVDGAETPELQGKTHQGLKINEKVSQGISYFIHIVLQHHTAAQVFTANCSYTSSMS